MEIPAKLTWIMRFRGMGLGCLVAASAWAQTAPCINSANAFASSNSGGSFFMRHVQFTTDANNNIISATSIWGTIIFDSSGHYSFSGTQVIDTASPAAYNVSGAYCISYPSGSAYMTMSNPQDSTLTINTGLGRLLIGSSTGSPANTSDLMIAIPSPTLGVPVPSVGEGFVTTIFSVTPGTPSTVRSSGFALNFLPNGGMSNQTTIQDFVAEGRVSGVNGGALLMQNYHGVTAVQNGQPGSVNGDGTVTFQMPAPTGDSPGTPLLASTYNAGFAVLYYRSDGYSGAIVLGGSTTSHDILLGFCNSGPVNFGQAPIPYSLDQIKGDYLAAGISYNSVLGLQTYSGLARVLSPGQLLYSRRAHNASQGTIDEAQLATITVNANDGSGTVGGMPSLLINSRESWLDAPLDAADTNTFGFDVATALVPEPPPPPAPGSNQLYQPFISFGMANAASGVPPSPAGLTISRGELLVITGTNLASQTLAASPPLPTTLAGVSVNVGGALAPLYMVSASEIICVVPYAAKPGPGGVNTSIGYQNGSQSYTINGIRLAATAPGIFTLDPSVAGSAIVVHSDGSLVSAAKPATHSEPLLAYVTGLGQVQGTPSDTGGATAPAPVNATVQISISGVQVAVQAATLVPYQPGLYQVNFTVPSAAQLMASGTLPIAISTADATIQVATIPVQ